MGCDFCKIDRRLQEVFILIGTKNKLLDHGLKVPDTLLEEIGRGISDIRSMETGGIA